MRSMCQRRFTIVEVVTDQHGTIEMYGYVYAIIIRL